jgi:predicted flap endonuclease-1-like 5' DNA nuclease
MGNLIPQFVQTVNEPFFKTLVLMTVMAIIGYITAWLYCKMIYKKRLHAAISEALEMNNQMILLKRDKDNLNAGLREKENENEHLILQINAIKTHYSEKVPEPAKTTLKNKRSGQQVYEKDKALLHIAQCKQLLHYEGFGKANIEQKDDLKMIRGIGHFIEEKLHSLDIYTFSQISKFTAEDIETISDAFEHFSGRIKRDDWVNQAVRFAKKHKASGSELLSASHG